MKSFRHRYGEFISSIGENLMVVVCVRSLYTKTTAEDEMDSLANEFKCIKHRFISNSTAVFYKGIECNDFESLLYDMAGGTDKLVDVE